MNCNKLVIGVGGSATNDGGLGVAQALGVRFYDSEGREIGLGVGGEQLKHIKVIDTTHVDPRVKDCQIIVASDVRIPLCGESGAATVFGPQKGATPEMIAELDRGLMHFALLIKKQLGIDILNLCGSGAAGGLSGGLVAFLSAEIRSGIETVFEFTGIRKYIEQVDYVITGEGKIDRQTSFGKAPLGIAQLAKKFDKPVICIAGGTPPDVDYLYEYGIDVIIGATQSPMSLADALRYAARNVEHAAYSIAQMLHIGEKNTYKHSQGVENK